MVNIPNEIISLEQQLVDGNELDLDEIYLLLYDFQSTTNSIYQSYLKQLKFDKRYPDLCEIPFLPISFYKYYAIKSGKWEEELIFKSSSTTGKGRSKHYLKSENLYKAVSKNIFETLFGSLSQYKFAALLPGYLERGESSLVYMVNSFMDAGRFKNSGFFLDQYKKLKDWIEADTSQEVILFGVPFAFIKCFNEIGAQQWNHVRIIETGGMKGQSKEMTKAELHEFINDAFQPKSVMSEYGMTELLSQAYSIRNFSFQQPQTMSIFIRELNDPFSEPIIHRPGTLNIFDIANIYTCSFIETEDLALQNALGEFEILGRIDNRELRGCNLLAV